MDIWQTPPFTLSTWFMNGPLRKCCNNNNTQRLCKNKSIHIVISVKLQCNLHNWVCLLKIWFKPKRSHVNLDILFWIHYVKIFWDWPRNRNRLLILKNYNFHWAKFLKLTSTFLKFSRRGFELSSWFGGIHPIKSLWNKEECFPCEVFCSKNRWII